MRIIVYMICLLPAIGRAQDVNSLLEALSDPDSSKRIAAEAQLSRLGSEARPALVDAIRGGNPAIASSASRILMALPWYRPTDSPQVRTLLANYGEFDEPGRTAIVGQLARLPALTGLPAMLRLVVEEPSEDICWEVVKILVRPPPRGGRGTPIMLPLVQAQVRTLNPPDNRPAALLLLARAWLAEDRPKAVALFRRAVDTETRHPTYDDGELDLAFDVLVDAEVVAQRYDAAADLRRHQAARIGISRQSHPDPVYHLFLLHARYGPLTGFDRDIELNSAYLGQPQVLYAIARVYERTGRFFEALATNQAAHNASLMVSSRNDTADFLYAAGWVDPLRREYSAIMDGDDPARRFQPRALAMLASLATRDDAELAGIEHFREQLRLVSQPGIGWEDGVDRRALVITDYSAEILLRQARIALAKGNRAEAMARFDELVALNPSDTDVVQNSYPILLSFGRREDALRLFELAYARLKESLAAEPTAPLWWNDLAWLCIRCDQKLDEALELSKRALAADPDNAAYIDTLAEIHFRMGQAAEAVKLESRALQIEPGDIFMTKQLERFKAGVKP